MLADACDVAHFMLAERVEADVREARMAALLVTAVGASMDEPPSIEEALADLERQLSMTPVPPAPVDRREAVLRVALGLSPGTGR